MTATAAALLDAARKTLGMHEDPSGSNKQPFAKCAGHANGQPWCASWAVCMARRVGLKLPGESAYTPTLAQAFRDAKRWGTRPAVGAFVFFRWPSMGRIAHVGIVEAVRPDGSIVTLEGNTDDAGGRTGGKVMRHVRRVNVAGYGYPVFAKPPAPVKPPAPAKATLGPYPGRVLRRGLTKDAAVAKVQRRLGLPADGVFGPRTEASVKAFQGARHLTVDGAVGPTTWKELAR